MSDRLETKVKELALKDASKAIKKMLGDKSEVDFSSVVKEVSEHPGDYPYLACLETLGKKSTLSHARDSLGFFAGKDDAGKNTIRTTPWSAVKPPSPPVPDEVAKKVPKQIAIERIQKESTPPDTTDLLMRSLDKNGAANIAALESVRREYVELRGEMKELSGALKQLYDSVQVFSRATWTQLDTNNELLQKIVDALDEKDRPNQLTRTDITASSHKKATG